MSHTIINTLLAVANILVVVVLVRQKTAIKKERDHFKGLSYETHEALQKSIETLKEMKAKYDEWEQELITAHQRELDALRAKHLEQCAEKQAETEMYMEAAKRLKEENDAWLARIAVMTVKLAAFKDVYTGGTPIKIEEG